MGLTNEHSEPFLTYFRKVFLSTFFIFIIFSFFIPVAALAIEITNVSLSSTSLPVYDKQEVIFQVNTNSKFTYFEYTTSPPPGIEPGIGVTVLAEITNSDSGKTVTHPAFYMTETVKTGTGTNVKFTETNKKYWVVRYSPLETGNHTVQLKATDSSGTTTVSGGSFTATPAVKDGYVKVSQTDKRYFEFSNGKIYWPIGPVYWDEDFSKYKSTGLNFSRQWMAGAGAYSANWARWKSSAEQLGNEGIATRLAFLDSTQKYPDSDGLVYNLEYPNAPRYWLTGWLDDHSFTAIKPNTTYQITFKAKVSGITGPRVASYPYGLVVKFGNSIWNNPTTDTVENTLRTAPKPFGHITTTQGTNGWQTFQTTFTTPSTTGTDIWVYLDNVTAGRADVYELSIKENGAEVVRNPVADMHTYFEQRPAAFFDWQVQQAEANGIYLQYNVHDKNDPIFKSLKEDGTWAGWNAGSGYDHPYNTKSSWLKRQWYRYLIARWGYSTSVFSFEAVNEADPNNTAHWQSVQENMAKYMKSISFRPVLTATSFWCCSLKDGFPFFSNSLGKYPDIDYVDLHEYSGNPNTTSSSYTNDVSEWVNQIGEVAYAKNAGKPLIWAENGLSSVAEWWLPLPDTRVTTANPGTWYHNMLWSQLTRGAAFPVGYWFNTEHIQKITGGKQSITQPFYTFIKDIDYNKGGYNAAGATSSNSKIKAYGQKKSDGSKAYLWIQNKDHEWDKTSTPQTGTITLDLTPNTDYTVQRWNTYSGAITQTQTIKSDGSGYIALPISSLTDDYAIKIVSSGIQSTPVPTSVSSPIPTTNPTIIPTSTPVPEMKNGDVNSDGLINTTDIRILLSNLWKSGTGALDQYGDGFINSFDLAVASYHMKNTQPTPTTVPPTTVQPSVTNAPVPTQPPAALSSEWTQHAQNAQRTSYTNEVVETPWKWKWTWNGPNDPRSPPVTVGDKTIQPLNQKLELNNQITQYGSTPGLPRNVQPVTGGGRVYIGAGQYGVYALDAQTGAQLWNSRPGGNINSTVAYDPDTGSIFAVSADGSLYKLNAATGAVIGSISNTTNITSTSKFNRLPLPPAIAGDSVFFAMGNKVFAVNKRSTSQTLETYWIYNLGTTIAQTPVSYSATRGSVIVGTRDLYIHSIKNSTGALMWSKKPTVRVPNPSGDDFVTNTDLAGNQAELTNGWPVISEKNGLVLIKYRLDWNTLWGYTAGIGGRWPTTNSEMRTFLQSNPSQQALFALDLDTGAVPFGLNVGHGGFGDGNYMPMGPQPVVRTLPDGSEVAYSIIRGSDVSDGRWDSRFGEVALNNTISGVQPGDVRFIEYNTYGNWERYNKGWENASENPTDEQPQLSMAGNQLLGGHWMAGKPLRIEDRSSQYGSYINPILSSPLPHIVTSTTSEATQGCVFNVSHYCSGNMLFQEGDKRQFAGPGFYIYYGNYGYSGNSTGSAIYDTYWSEYATYVVSNNTIFFRSTDGAVMALMNGSPLSVQENKVSNVAGASTVQEGAAQDNILYSIKASDAQKYVEKEVALTDTIESAFNNGKAFYITFASTKKNGFKIRILKEDWNSFTKPLESLFKKGQKITVYSEMNTYQGKPVIYVNNSSQITVLK